MKKIAGANRSVNLVDFCYLYRLLYGDQAAYFDMEMKPRIKHTKLGHISMVNNGSNMHGSQVSHEI